jgi:hypothetical protein
MEAEATTLSNTPPPAQTTEITSEPPPTQPTVPTSIRLASESAETATPAPTSFTISYTPLLHPEPAATRSGTNAIQFTQFELSKMLRQAFQQGSEQGYKSDLADAVEKLNTQYEDRHLEALNDFADRMQESSDNAFEEGFLVGTREERERQESARASQVNVSTQMDTVTTSISASVQTDHLVTSTSTTATASVQTNIPFIPSSSSASISTQTESQLPTATLSESSPILISEPPIPAISSAPFDWANDTFPLSTLPLILPKQPRDLSSLRSSSKNPFSSLRRRHYYSKHPKNSPSCRYSQPYPTHQPIHHAPPLHNNLLDWHRDPRLFELSRVLRTLGWSHS